MKKYPYLVLFTGLGLAFALKGRLVDEQQKPIPAADLTLKHLGLQTQSGSDGVFNFDIPQSSSSAESSSSSDGTPNLQALPADFKYQISQGSLNISVSNAIELDLTLYAPNGQLLGIWHRSMEKGQHHLSLAEIFPHFNPYSILKIKIGQAEKSIILNEIKSSSYSILTPHPLSPPLDTLVIQKKLFQPFTQAIFDYQADLGDLQMSVFPVDYALATGDFSVIKDPKILGDSILAQFKGYMAADRNQLFNLNADGTSKQDGSSLTAITWDPTYRSNLIRTTSSNGTPVLLTNSVYTVGKTILNKPIAIMGNKVGRYMAMGGDPIYTNNANEQMHSFLANTFAWLTHKTSLTGAKLNIVSAHLNDGSAIGPDSTLRSWFKNRFPGVASFSKQDSCNGTKFAACVAQKPDLIVIGQHQASTISSENMAVANEVEKALKNGIPVFYIQYKEQNELAKLLLQKMDIERTDYNYWTHQSLTDFSPLGSDPRNATYAPILSLIQNLKDTTYKFDWSACVDGSNCPKPAGFDTDFSAGANQVRSMLTGLDQKGIEIWKEPDYKVEKMLVLLGDLYRSKVTYPMDIKTTNNNQFLRSYFADFAVYNLRPSAPVPNSLGNFSRTNFSHIVPTTKTVNMTSKVYFRAAGVYALPGQKVRVIRLDNNPVSTKIFVNSIRSGSTHEFDPNQYNRPKFLWSASMPLTQGDTLEFTSVYGGPIQIEFGTNEQNVSLKFENIGLHAYWASSADDAAFTKALADSSFDWAELVTPGFEVHSLLGRMKTSMNGANWGSAAALAAGTMRYTHNFPHVLAGFQGPGIDVVPEIHDFAKQKGWTIQTVDLVKHMNADQPTCGWGCSGNPYDAGWSFDPIGHGDIHELGHGLEKGRFKFAGWEGHTVTNPYSYYTKSRFYLDKGIDPGCQSLPFKEQFDTLQASLKQVDPGAYVNSYMNPAGTVAWNKGVALTVQMMMLAQNQGKLIEGWHLLSRLHIMEREFAKADDSEANWALAKDSLGFGSYALAEAQAVSNNDWMLIGLSWVTGMDFRDYLSMWGITYTQKAADQVASFKFPMAPRLFFGSEPSAFCMGFANKPALKVDGLTPWNSVPLP